MVGLKLCKCWYRIVFKLAVYSNTCTGVLHLLYGVCVGCFVYTKEPVTCNTYNFVVKYPLPGNVK